MSHSMAPPCLVPVAVVTSVLYSLGPNWPQLASMAVSVPSLTSSLVRAAPPLAKLIVLSFLPFPLFSYPSNILNKHLGWVQVL